MTLRLNTADQSFNESFKKLIENDRNTSQDVSKIVASILEQIKCDGDKALTELTNKYDTNSLTLEQLKLSKETINELDSRCEVDIKESMEIASKRITEYHKRQLPADQLYTDETGTTLGYQWKPIERVGIYVPGGTASYPSTVLMNAIPAIVAGVEDIVMVTPASNGKLNPSTLYAAKLLNINEVYQIGGAQAIGALAFGTDTINKVDKIVGPGNAYVAEAKKQVFGLVGIDMFAGPSEIVIVADESNNPKITAADLLSQAEHDNSAQSILITDNDSFANKVETEVLDQLNSLPRKDIASESWERHGAIIVTKDINEAIQISNQLAPEHLELSFQNAKEYLNDIKHAGAIFVGTSTPEAIGDYLAGPSHVLPTDRTARYSSGLSVFDFIKRTSIIECTPESLEKIGADAMSMAKDEGLDGHARSIEYRLSKK
jgi:histidinol dehydrogenase